MKGKKKAKRGGRREGAGRPVTVNSQKKSIMLPAEMWDRIDQARGETSISMFLREKLDGVL